MFSPAQRHTAQLREELLKLPCPEGLDPDADEAPEVCRADAEEQGRAGGGSELPTDFQL